MPVNTLLPAMFAPSSLLLAPSSFFFFCSSPGTIGHVAHGKSTLVKAISGVQTVRFKSELRRNITIKLGYANAKVCSCRQRERRLGACSAPGKSGALFVTLQPHILFSVSAFLHSHLQIYRCSSCPPLLRYK